MTDEEKRIAIAEACGWRIESDGLCTFVYPPNETTGKGYRLNDIRHPKIIRLLPDYLNDMNAIREACLWALHNLWDSDQVELFTRSLQSSHPSATFKNHDAFDPYDAAFIIIECIPQDWCYAFLTASNLWKP